MVNPNNLVVLNQDLYITNAIDSLSMWKSFPHQDFHIKHIAEYYTEVAPISEKGYVQYGISSEKVQFGPYKMVTPLTFGPTHCYQKEFLYES